MPKFVWRANQLALDFVNREIMQNGQRVDLLGSLDDLRQWMDEAGTLASKQGEGIEALGGTAQGGVLMRRVRTLRSAVRSLADALAGHYPVPESSLKAINELLRTEPEFLHVTRTRGRYSMEFKRAGSGPLDPLVPVARAVTELLVNAKSGTIRKCAHPACILYFNDTTKNHTRQWCSMSTCSNRIKVETFYRRQPRKK